MAYKEEKNKRKKAVTPFIICGLAVILAAGAGISARYIHQRSRVNAVAANEFYFTSDLLSEKGNSYTLSAETEDLTIELRNYADSYRRSGKDITYSYEVVKDSAQTAIANGTGTIKAKASTENTSLFTIKNMSPGTYEVTAKSETPFVQTLKGTFIIPEKQNDISCEISDSSGSPYVLLTVSVKDYKGSVVISWPKGLIPDSTQEAFANVVTKNGDSYTAGNTTVFMDPYTSGTYRFFKTDTQTDHTEDTALNAVAGN